MAQYLSADLRIRVIWAVQAGMSRNGNNAASGQGHRGDAGYRQARPAVAQLTLRDSGVRFSAVDMPEANDLTVGIMALVTQQERQAISRRTKEALSVARSRGVKLGNQGRHGARADRQERCAAGRGLRAMADELKERGILTRRGGGGTSRR